MTEPGALLEALRKELAREYEIQEYLGRGNLALVYKAVQIEPRRAVALKVVPPDAPAGLGERVRREARVASNLVHANIVPIYAVGQAAGADYYAMRYEDGCSLDWVIAKRGALPVPLVLTVLRALLSGLAYAHDRHVIHRDVTGANVFVNREGGIALADTGIARAVREKGAAAPVAGSPLFMSPEQCAGKPVGPQADQYAIGVLAFQMLTGQPPFEATTAQALIEMHISAPPPEIDALCSDVPRALVDVVGRALAKTPAERYPTARDMLRAVQAVPLSEDEQSAALEQLREMARRAPPATPLGGAPPAEPVAPAQAREERARPAAPQPQPAPPIPEPAPVPAPPATVSAPQPRRAAPPPPPAPKVSAPPPRPAEPAAPQPRPQPALPIPESAFVPAPAAMASAPQPRPAEPAPPPAPMTSGSKLASELVCAPERMAAAGPVPSASAAEPSPAEPASPPAPGVSAPLPTSEPPRSPEATVAAPAPAEPPPPGPRRRIPVVPIAGGVALVGVVAVVAVVSLGRQEGPARAAAAAADSAPSAVPRAGPAVPGAVPAAPANSAVPAAPQPAAAVGYVRLRGELPEGAVVWLDERRVSGRLFQASPGSHSLQIETDDFEPYERSITVRAGDTLRVSVELTLKTPPDPVP